MITTDRLLACVTRCVRSITRFCHTLNSPEAVAVVLCFAVLDIDVPPKTPGTLISRCNTHAQRQATAVGSSGRERSHRRRDWLQQKCTDVHAPGTGQGARLETPVVVRTSLGQQGEALGRPWAFGCDASQLSCIRSGTARGAEVTTTEADNWMMLHMLQLSRWRSWRRGRTCCSNDVFEAGVAIYGVVHLGLRMVRTS
eukprot:jgi/Ulvmu1/6747/UM030_0082.1